MTRIFQKTFTSFALLLTCMSSSWALYEVYDLGAVQDFKAAGCVQIDGPRAISNPIGSEIIIAGTIQNLLTIWDGAVKRGGVTLSTTKLQVSGIDSSGNIVGSYENVLGKKNAFMVSAPYDIRADLATDINTIESNATGIVQGSGGATLISGFIGTPDPQNPSKTVFHGVLWSATNTVPRVLLPGTLGINLNPPIPGTITVNIESSYATAINSSGNVAGYSEGVIAIIPGANTPKVQRSTLWNQATISEIGFTNRVCSDNAVPLGNTASDINEIGQVVGMTQSVTISTSQNGCWNQNVGFVYDSASNPQFQELPSYPSAFGKSIGSAVAINKSGDIVGLASPNTTNPCNEPKATLWLKDLNGNYVIEDLNQQIASGTGWVLEDAIDINDQGQIIGLGHLNGVPHGFILNPAGTPIKVPAPPAGGGADPGTGRGGGAAAPAAKKRGGGSSGLLESSLLLFMLLLRSMLPALRKFS